MKPGQDILNQALALHKAGQWADAETLYERVLALNPASTQAHYLAGLLQQQLNRPDRAVPYLRRACALAPANTDYLATLANALFAANALDDALAHNDRLLALKPTAQAHNNRGVVLFTLRRLEEALQSFDAALALDAGLAVAHNNRANVLRDLRQLEPAVASYKNAIALDPTIVEAHINLANVYARQKRTTEAVTHLTEAYRLQPGFKYVAGYLLHAKMLCCDWSGYDALLAEIEADLNAGKKAAEPFGYQAAATSPALLKKCAEIFAADHFPARPLPVPVQARSTVRPGKIRIGYVCGEFRDQATSILMTEVYESHDRERFEIFAFDNGWDDGSRLRQRMNRAFTEIVDISPMGDSDAAHAVQQRGIDILVNLNGYFGDNRPGLFALKPAPVQVNYLGFPGTLGTDVMDYIIADETVIPHAEQAAYTERVVYLPESYQANDSQRIISGELVTRAWASLPADRFVFCCFNNNYKITPHMFGAWMRILKRSPESVLWLLEDNAAAAQNLRAAAEASGVEAQRLIFAPRLPSPVHLARHRLADLFLDTLPYNAHTTASDALWAGLPVLTALGTTFPGRVSASLLRALNMPELIMPTLETFEDEAVRLAHAPESVAALKVTLAAKRLTAPLFNGARLARHLEDAFTEMHRRSTTATPPGMIIVKPRPL
jgi:predicted O-linked N-acetylglucosamine transferase (SPINDLY family)